MAVVDIMNTVVIPYMWIIITWTVCALDWQETDMLLRTAATSVLCVQTSCSDIQRTTGVEIGKRK